MNAGACNEPRQGSLSHCLPSSRICNPSARSPASDSANWHQGEGPRHFSWVASYSRVWPPLKDSWRGITSHSHLDCSSTVNVFLMAGLRRPKGEHPFLIITAPVYKDWTERPLAYTHTLRLLLSRLNGSDSFNLSAKILLAHTFIMFVDRLWNLPRIPTLSMSSTWGWTSHWSFHLSPYFH